MEKNKKPFYKKAWFILIVILVIIGLISSVKSGIKNVSDKKATYTWPQSTLAGMIPTPESKYGKVGAEQEEFFSIEVYKVSKEDFEKYVEDCKNKGFILDYMGNDNFYSAEHADGYSLQLTYNQKEKTMSIILSVSKQDTSYDEKAEDILSVKSDETLEEEAGIENTESNTEESVAEETAGETDDEGGESAERSEKNIRPEFKEVLDGYEQFMGSYCEFMGKYTDPNNAGDIVSMMADYTKLLKEEVEWSEKVDALEDEEMTDAEAKYYADVMLRVSQKMIEVSQ